jgi:hypothetical protein
MEVMLKKVETLPPHRITPVHERLLDLSYVVAQEEGFPFFFMVKVFPVREDATWSERSWGVICAVDGWDAVFKTEASLPGLDSADGVLRDLLKDHFYKLTLQINTVFNCTDGKYWLKPEYQIPKK